MLRRRYLGFALAPGAVVVIVCVVRYVQTSEPAVLFGCAGVFVVALGWCAWYWIHLRRRARAILVKTRGLTCLSCGFSLVGLEENGQCPECGEGYYADELSRCWSNAAGFP